VIRTKALVLSLALAMSLILAGSAWASYWFYQGNLPGPMSNGARAVFYYQFETQGLTPPIYVRESWDNGCQQDMNYAWINLNSGSWFVGTFFPQNGCDQHVQDTQPNRHLDWGCENPYADPVVYDNCYAGSYP
jgi:hypothetical protein